jgi:predicted S18 family serine protease
MEGTMKVKNLAVPAVVALASLSLLLLCGCAQPPKQEMDAANAAVTMANNADAKTYAPDEMAAVQDLLDQMSDQIQKKDYKAAKATAIQLREKAEEARAAAETNKAKAKEDAETAVNEVKQELEKVKEAFAKAETDGVPVADLTPMKDQLTAVEPNVTSLDGMMTNEQYKDALTQAQEAKNTLGQLDQAVSGAVEKFTAAKEAAKGKKPGRKK